MFVSQLLEWVRVALFGRRTPGRHSSAHTPKEAPQAPRTAPRPDVMGARLVTARRTRRDRRPAPPVDPYPPQPQGRAEWFPSRDWEAEEAWEPAGALVRPYVDALGVTPRNGRTGAQADPWGRVQ